MFAVLPPLHLPPFPICKQGAADVLAQYAADDGEGSKDDVSHKAEVGNGDAAFLMVSDQIRCWVRGDDIATMGNTARKRNV